MIHHDYVGNVTLAEYTKYLEDIDFEKMKQMLGQNNFARFIGNLRNTIQYNRICTLIEFLEQVHKAIEGGYADTSYPPDLTGEIPSEGVVNDFIDRFEQYHQDELNNHPDYWKDKGSLYPPDFRRLSGSARLGVYQGYYRLKRSLGL